MRENLNLFTVTDEYEDYYAGFVRIVCETCGRTVTLVPYQNINTTTIKLSGCPYCASKRIVLEEE